MAHYCTFFDSAYLAQGLALLASLVRHDPAAVCWTLPLDETTTVVLRALQPPGVRVMPMVDVLAADPALAGVRGNRTRAEFAFTLKPSLCRHLMEVRPEIEVLTYVDADIYFFGTPDLIAQVLGSGSVLVVPHRFPPWHDESARYGCFNAGVLAFRRDEAGRACLEWWRQQCLASCAITRDGEKYGDQKYLDQFAGRFSGVVVCAHPGINLAPWNWARHRVTLAGEGIAVDGQPLIVFHFAQFRAMRGCWYDSGQLEYGIMPRSLRSRLYGAYAAALDAATVRLQRVAPGFNLPRRDWRAALGPWHLAALRLFWGQFWRRGTSSWTALGFGLGRWSGRFMGSYRRWQRRRDP